MKEPTVADALEWGALSDETRARYTLLLRDTIRREVFVEILDAVSDGEDAVDYITLELEQ